MKPSAAPVTLIFNPAAGRAALLELQLPHIKALLAARGFAVRVHSTSPDPESASLLAASAAAVSAVVIACGGDGTVHGVVQGLAHTRTPLGVLPLGTANALARNLKLRLDPLEAMERLLTYTPALVPLGEIITPGRRRFFLVMAGCGPDGALVHTLSGESARRFKSRFGRAAYYVQAARLFLLRRWPSFAIEFRPPGSSDWQKRQAVALLASRIPDLGGLFTGLTRHAELTANHLHVQILAPPAQLSFVAWFMLSRFGFVNPWLESVDVEELRCFPLSSSPVYAQADAEPVGPLPLRMQLVPAALMLMVPPAWSPRMETHEPSDLT
jgi:diacylglycerol kinase family enzyme